MLNVFLSLVVVILIIIYRADVWVANLDFLATVALGPQHRLPSPARQKPSQPPSFLSDIDAFVNQFLETGICEPIGPSPVDPGNQSEKAGGKHIPHQEWKVHQTPMAPELLERQVGF